MATKEQRSSGRPVNADAMNHYINQALDGARQRAAQDNNRKPTLEDYRQAARELGKAQGLSENDWNPKSYANFSGKNLTGFEICDPTVNRANGRKTKDLYDLDGDGAAGDFYSNINFYGATLSDCIVDPAASFNTQLKNAKELTNVTFNDHDGQARFELGSGKYENIKLTNFKGGEVILDGSQVKGLDMHGQKIASLEFRRHGGQQPSVDMLNADGARMVKIVGDPGAQISNSSFRNTTISQAGKMHGMVLTDTDFSGANLPVDLSEARLTRVTLPASRDGLRGLNLSHAKLDTVTFDDGSPVTVTRLRQLGVKTDGMTITHARQPHTVEAALAGANLAALGVQGGQTVTAPDPGRAVTQLEKPVSPDRGDGMSMNMFLAIKAAQSAGLNGNG